MLWTKKQEPLKESPEVFQRPKPKLAIVKARQFEIYEEVAKQIGFIPAQLLEEKLIKFLTEHNIPIFDYNEVDKYLKKKTKYRSLALSEVSNSKKAWIWKPLREQDKPLGWHWGEPWHPTYEGSYFDDWNHRPYSKAVPLHILKQVKLVEENFPNQLLFFVSDYVDVHPDPFIMVTALDVKKIIFGVWDEPDYGIG